MDGLCLLATLAIAAHSAEHRHPPSCATAMDCHLNGECIAGACKCKFPYLKGCANLSNQLTTGGQCRSR
jgi:CBS-domain-containing membrane protein